MAALSAARWKPDMEVLCERLATSGKKHTAALLAVMCKLIILANVLLRVGQEWARHVPQTGLPVCGQAMEKPRENCWWRTPKSTAIHSDPA